MRPSLDEILDESPLSYHTLIFDLMSSRNMYLYNAYIYTYILFISFDIDNSLY